MYTLRKFKGKFRDLIPAGYTFQKLYARNYRCYWKNTKYCDNIWIWQHLGGYIEINDFYDNSGLIIDAVLQDKERGWYGYWALDRKTGTLVPYELELHDVAIRVSKGEIPDFNEPGGKEAIQAHLDRWRRVGIESETIAEIKIMNDKGWIGEETFYIKNR